MRGTQSGKHSAAEGVLPGWLLLGITPSLAAGVSDTAAGRAPFCGVLSDRVIMNLADSKKAGY